MKCTDFESELFGATPIGQKTTHQKLLADANLTQAYLTHAQWMKRLYRGLVNCQWVLVEEIVPLLG